MDGKEVAQVTEALKVQERVEKESFREWMVVKRR